MSTIAVQRHRRALGILGTQVLDQLELVVVGVCDDDNGVGVIGASVNGDVERMLKLRIAAFAIDVTVRKLNEIFSGYKVDTIW